VDRAGTIRQVFGVPRALIGCVHVGALPGTPRARESVDSVAERAAAEAREYHAHGFHGVIIENMHDRPYLKRSVGPEIVAGMTAVAREVRRAMPLPFGVQVLAGANLEAMAVAAASAASFIRAEGFVFAHVADEGLIESSAGELLRYRRAIGAEGVRVFADVKKKHAAHALTADVDLVETAHAAELFLVDGVIVTGIATGRAAAAEEVRAVADAGGVPTLVGSGITADNVGEYAAADGYVVGSWLKRDGDWTQPLDPPRLDALARAVERLPRQPA